jgi:hypothetical protein
MGNSTFGPLARKALAWIIVALVVVFAFRVLIAIIAGLFQTLFAVALLVLVVFAGLWAIRRL